MHKQQCSGRVGHLIRLLIVICLCLGSVRHVLVLVLVGALLLIIGGILLGLLAIAYIVALFFKVEGASNILVLLGSGLGFLLGGRDRGQSNDS